MNRTSKGVAALAIVIGLVFAPAAFAQDTTGVGAVRGVVADTRQAPIGDVAICLEGTGLCTASDADGRFVVVAGATGWLVNAGVIRGGLLVSSTTV